MVVTHSHKTVYWLCFLIFPIIAVCAESLIFPKAIVFVSYFNRFLNGCMGFEFSRSSTNVSTVSLNKIEIVSYKMGKY